MGLVREVRYRLGDGQPPQTRESKNLAAHGLFIRCPRPAAVGDPLQLEIVLGPALTVRAVGRVAWSRKPDLVRRESPGMGVELLELADADRAHLLELVRAHGDAPTSPTAAPASAPAPTAPAPTRPAATAKQTLLGFPSPQPRIELAEIPGPALEPAARESEPEAEREPEAEPESEPEAEREPEPEPESESESESEREPESEPEPEPERDAEPRRAPERAEPRAPEPAPTPARAAVRPPPHASPADPAATQRIRVRASGWRAAALPVAVTAIVLVIATGLYVASRDGETRVPPAPRVAPAEAPAPRPPPRAAPPAPAPASTTAAPEAPAPPPPSTAAPAPPAPEVATAPSAPEVGADPMQSARAALAAGHGEQAVQLFREALAHRAPPMAWSGLGQACELVGDQAGAIEAYRKFIELRPALPEAERLRRRIRYLGGR